MSARGIVIVGTGGAAREALVLLRDIQRETPGVWDFRGFLALDDPEPGLLERLGATFLGNPLSLPEAIPAAKDWCFVTGIGNPTHRRAMDATMRDQGLEPTTLVHPTVRIGDDVTIGVGSTIAAYTVVTTNVRVGLSAQINVGCVIAHEARIGDYVTLAQNVNLAGDVTIGDDVTLHTQAIVDRGRTIGARAIVGSGAVVTNNVAAGVTAIGVPARPMV